MNNLISDIRTAAGVFKDIRRERKAGIQKCRALPCISGPGAGFYNTVEGCVLANCSRDVNGIARAAFNRLPYEEQCRLLPLPKDGEFMGRAGFWKELLKPLMTPAQYTEAITAILHWYIHIKHLRQEGAIC